MKRISILNNTKLRVNKSYQGETIEQKMERVVQQNEPIKDGAPLVFTEKKRGVLPEYDIRTDRFEIAIDGTDAIQKSMIAKREMAMKSKEKETGDQSQ